MLRQALLGAGMLLGAAAPVLAQVQITPAPPPPPPVTATTVTTTPSETIIVAPHAPPAPRAETPPPPSMPDLVWKAGHWAWNVSMARYDWVDGTYVERPAKTAAYTPGFWRQQPDGWHWVDGHWR